MPKTVKNVKFTPELNARLAAHTQRWIDNAMRTDPVDKPRLVDAIKRLYAAANLAEPIVVVVPSPAVMAFAGGFASGIWHLRTKTGFEPYAATVAATVAATRAATDAATVAATDAATVAATVAATRAATYAATRAATVAATYAATDTATVAATDTATGGWPLELAMRLAEGNQVIARFLLNCAARWHGPYQGGNMWSGWASYLSAFRDVHGLELAEHAKYQAWEDCAIEGGFRWMHEKFCMICDRPEILTKDEQNRPHNESGPSHRWRDGWSLYHWHGVRVSAHVIMEPARITMEEIEKEENAEIRRVLITRMGAGKYLSLAKSKIIHMDVWQGLPRALMRDRYNDQYMCGSDNSTGRVYFMPVDPNAKTCTEAHESICGFSESLIDAQS